MTKAVHIDGAVATWILKGLSFAGIAGLVVLATAMLVGFEEMGTGLLIVSVVLMLSTPLGVLLHLWLTNDLTREQKRAWRRELSGSRAAIALSEYLANEDRAAAAERMLRRHVPDVTTNGQ
jgi:hypothetical protein